MNYNTVIVIRINRQS